jgi:tetratricopeptide (TPR) repeat protein
MDQQESATTSTTDKGKAFFDRAEQVAATGNWDFAIEMYLEGIQREPGSVEQGHQPLREVALKRKAQGGKGPGVLEQLKRRQGKDPVLNLVNAEHLLAKDPGSVQYMLQTLRAAGKLELTDVVSWIAKILLQAQHQASKPSKRILLEVTKAFESIEDFTLAVRACDMALKGDPDDGELRNLMRNLSAQETISRGRYEEKEPGEFTERVADMEKQKELMQQDSLVKDEDYLLEQVRKAREEYLESPTVVGKINALVDALLKMEDEASENEAVDVLTKAHENSGAYQFKMRIGDVRIRQMSRRFRALREAGDMAGAQEHARRQLAFELDEFTERVANYPTDLALKFELGRRQFLSGMLDEAIASLQQAQRDPRRSLHARSLIGQAFTRKGWYREAAETFERALESEMTEERAKELRYFLGDVLDQMGELAQAQKQFSIVAQIDYNYKDVRTRLEDIRKKLKEGGDEAGEPAKPDAK